MSYIIEDNFILKMFPFTNFKPIHESEVRV